MDKNKLLKYDFSELKTIAEKLDIPPRKSKSQMISDIFEAMKEYDEYKKNRLEKYQKISQLGEAGKEGTTFLVKDVSPSNLSEYSRASLPQEYSRASLPQEYAMKCFRKAKSSKTLKKEYSLLRKAGKAGIAPRAIDYDSVSKYIVMEKLDGHLYSDMKKNGKLKKKHQLRILKIFETLDNLQIFHNDSNILNYMLKDDEVYMIDFGFSKEITPKLVKKLETEKPNSHLMTVGLVIKLKELKFKEESYKYLLKALPKVYVEKYSL